MPNLFVHYNQNYYIKVKYNPAVLLTRFYNVMYIRQFLNKSYVTNTESQLDGNCGGLRPYWYIRAYW